MENKKLIPLSDFVLEQTTNEWSATRRLSLIIGYAEFLKQPLTLEMLVGENKFFDGFELLATKTNFGDKQHILLFQGVEEFSFTPSLNYSIANTLLSDLENEGYEIPLTPSALKKIGIKE